MRAILFGGGLSLLISLLGTRYAIRFFTRQGFGQPIRDDGPGCTPLTSPGPVGREPDAARPPGDDRRHGTGNLRKGG